MCGARGGATSISACKMNEAIDLSLYAKPETDGTVGMDVAVEGIACGACIARIETAVKRLPGVTEARVNFTNRRLHVAWSDALTEPAQILKTLEANGYRGHPFVAQRAEQEEAAEARRLTRCLAVAGFAAMNVMLLSVSVWSGNATDITPETRDFFHWASALIALPAAAYAGRPFFSSAWQALKARTLNMNVPISLGVILALGMSVVETANHAKDAYYDSALMLLFFLLAGRTLEHAMRRKTRATAGNLAALRAETAHRFDGDELVSVPLAVLQAGDRVLVKPGERVPADGDVLSGASEIDDSLITGETARHKITPGATVYAGSLNYSGVLTMRVTATGGSALIDEIEKLLDKAASAKSRAMRLADRAANIYAPMVHITAGLTLVGWWLAGASLHDAVVTAIAVLIITCPCALALAIPAVQVVASGALFKNGVILNAGDAIERLAEADTVDLRQDRHADLAGAARGQRRRYRSRNYADGGAAGAVESSSVGAGAGARGGRRQALLLRGRGAGAGRARHDRRHRGPSRQCIVLWRAGDRTGARPVAHLFRPRRQGRQLCDLPKNCAPTRSRP